MPVLSPFDPCIGFWDPKTAVSMTQSGPPRSLAFTPIMNDNTFDTSVFVDINGITLSDGTPVGVNSVGFFALTPLVAMVQVTYEDTQPSYPRGHRIRYHYVYLIVCKRDTIGGAVTLGTPYLLSVSQYDTDQADGYVDAVTISVTALRGVVGVPGGFAGLTSLSNPLPSPIDDSRASQWQAFAITGTDISVSGGVTGLASVVDVGPVDATGAAPAILAGAPGQVIKLSYDGSAVVYTSLASATFSLGYRPSWMADGSVGFVAPIPGPNEISGRTANAMTYDFTIRHNDKSSSVLRVPAVTPPGLLGTAQVMGGILAARGVQGNTGLSVLTQWTGDDGTGGSHNEIQLWTHRVDMRGIPVLVTDANWHLEATFISSASSVVGAYMVTFSVASTVWTIAHTLDHRPIVETVDGSGNVTFGSVSFPDDTHVVIHWSAPTSGTATLV